MAENLNLCVMLGQVAAWPLSCGQHLVGARESCASCPLLTRGGRLHALLSLPSTVSWGPATFWPPTWPGHLGPQQESSHLPLPGQAPSSAGHPPSGATGDGEQGAAGQEEGSVGREAAGQRIERALEWGGWALSVAPTRLNAGRELLLSSGMSQILYLLQNEGLSDLSRNGASRTWGGLWHQARFHPKKHCRFQVATECHCSEELGLSV